MRTETQLHRLQHINMVEAVELMELMVYMAGMLCQQGAVSHLVVYLMHMEATRAHHLDRVVREPEAATTIIHTEVAAAYMAEVMHSLARAAAHTKLQAVVDQVISAAFLQ